MIIYKKISSGNLDYYVCSCLGVDHMLLSRRHIIVLELACDFQAMSMIVDVVD